METGKKIAAGVLPICKQTGKLLIIKRGPNQSGGGTWACFGGKFEPEADRSPKECAKREFAEESSFTGFYKITRMPLHVNSDNHRIFYTYVGIVGEEFVPDLERGHEATEYGWFSLGELPENLLPGFEETIEKKYHILENIVAFYTKKV